MVVLFRNYNCRGNMTMLLVFPFLLSLVRCSVIIPEELPSLLSVAYSNIPPIKKGTDSRVGFGFAFGNHADLQLTFELGPQTNTLNLTGQSFPTNTKRQAPGPPPPQPRAKIHKNREKFLQSDAGKYLQRWAEKMKQPPRVVKRPSDVTRLEESPVELVQNERGEVEIQQPRPSSVARPALEQLRRLYGERRQEEKRSDAEIEKITEELSNVDLD